MLPASPATTRGAPLTAAALVLIVAAGCSRQAAPNLLLVTFDTTRADRVGAYGYAAAHTPNLDRLAREGVRCSDAVAVAPITMPSHASILTGLLPPAHGVRDNGAYALGPGVTTLAERLKAKGYTTQAFVSAIVLSRRYGLDQGFDGYDDDLWAEDDPRLFMIRDRPAARTAERALAWLEGWQRRPEKDRAPFFAWVHFFDPHQPYKPPPEDRRATRTPYDAELSAADRGLGRLLDFLRSRELLDQTWVVMTADHGESLGEHGEKTHAVFVYDATLRVPLILRRPDALPGGTTYAGPVSSVDIVPTLLEGLGLEVPRDVQGQSLLSALRGRAGPRARPQYSESLLSELGFGMAPLFALRSQGYKYIRAPRPELYDLGSDPQELQNLYERERPRAERLERELQQLLERSSAQAQAARENPLTLESQEALRALGYVAPLAERHAMAGRDPKDGIAIYTKLEDARHFAQQKRWADAERLLREILKELPGHVSARNVLALVLLRQNKLDAARREYERALQDDPGQFRVLAVLGSLALVEGDLAQAERQFRAALERAPTFVEAMANLGFVQALRGDEAGARAWYDKALSADPRFPVVHRRLGDLYYERGDYRAARRHYEGTLAITPSDFQALVQAGNCAKHLGDAAAARDFYARATKLREDSWVPPYNRACLEARLGHAAEALAQLERAVQKGLKRATLVESDPELQSLHARPEFRRLLQGLARRFPAQAGDDEDLDG